MKVKNNISKIPIISIEGGDGSGKSTLILRLITKLDELGIDYIVTREPGGVPISEKIRELLHDSSYTNMDARTEALLFAAARRQHLVEKIFPAIEEGKLVIFDRYVDSSLVYQGYVRGLGIDEVYDINLFATEDFLPDYTFVLDLDPVEGQRRIHSGENREINRLDNEGMAFHFKVREGYRHLIGRYPERMIEVDASASPDEVFHVVWDKMEDLINV